jgi:hypothetical protein
VTYRLEANSQKRKYTKFEKFQNFPNLRKFKYHSGNVLLKGGLIIEDGGGHDSDDVQIEFVVLVVVVDGGKLGPLGELGNLRK